MEQYIAFIILLVFSMVIVLFILGAFFVYQTLTHNKEKEMILINKYKTLIHDDVYDAFKSYVLSYERLKKSHTGKADPINFGSLRLILGIFTHILAKYPHWHITHDKEHTMINDEYEKLGSEVGLSKNMMYLRNVELEKYHDIVRSYNSNIDIISHLTALATDNNNAANKTNAQTLTLSAT